MLETGGVLGSWFQAGSSPDCYDHLESKHIEISLSFPPLPPPSHIAFQIFLKMVVKGDECLTWQAGGFLSDVPLLRQAPIPCVMRALCSWGEAVSVCSVSRWWLQFGPMCLCLSHVKGGEGQFCEQTQLPAPGIWNQQQDSLYNIALFTLILPSVISALKIFHEKMSEIDNSSALNQAATRESDAAPCHPSVCAGICHPWTQRLHPGMPPTC